MGVELFDGLDLEGIEWPGARGLELVQEAPGLGFDAVDASTARPTGSGGARDVCDVVGPVALTGPLSDGRLQTVDDQPKLGMIDADKKRAPGMAPSGVSPFVSYTCEVP